MAFHRNFLLAITLCGLCLPLEGTDAATRTEQRAEIAGISKQVRIAERFAKSGKLAEAAEHFGRAVMRMQTIASQGVDPRLDKLLARAKELLSSAHHKLSAAGIEVAPLDLPDVPSSSSKPAEDEPGRDRGVSFAKDVAPMFVTRCGRCHIDQSKGGFNMSTFAALAAGSEGSGAVIVPRSARDSLIVELVASGDMPRGDGTVSKQELTMLARWIDEGANFDGSDRGMPLREMVNSGRSKPQVANGDTQIAKATGNESVRFALEIAPVLAESCTECHGGQRTRAGFDLTTFARLFQGGDSGPVVAPGNSAESLIVQRLKGEGGDRMPLNRDPLANEVVAKIETWIREGAKFDGASANDLLERTNALARADTASDAELSEMRAKLAAKNWRLAIPDETAKETSSQRFLVLGNLPQSRLQEIAGAADAQINTLKKFFRHEEDGPFVKGRVTLFAFARRFDYSEFGTMVERREMPPGWRGNWGFDGVDAYAAFFPATTDQVSDDVLLAQQIAGVYIASRGRGRLPRWIVEGAARSAAAYVNRKDPYVARWEQEIATAMSSQRKADDFMHGNLPLEPESILAYGFVRNLLRKPAKFQVFMSQVAGGTKWEEAFQSTYGRTATEIATLWVRQKS